MSIAELYVKKYGPLIGLAALIWLVFGQAVNFDFLFWDDYVHIVSNPHLQMPLWPWSNIRWIFSFDTSMRFEPVTWLGHVLICAIFTKNPGAYHFCLIILHFINSLLVYKLCLRILSKFATDDVPREAIAFLGSAFWALNAVRVEPLGLSADLGYPLATFFVLSSFSFYLISINQGRLKWSPYFFSFVLNGLAVCTWPISVGFAFCLPFFDRIFFPAETAHRWDRHSTGFVAYWASRIAFAFPSLASGLAMVSARFHPVGTYALGLRPVSPLNTIRLMHGAYAWVYIYLHQFWPFGLTPGHYPWPHSGFHAVYLLSLFCLLGAAMAAWRSRSSTAWALLAASACLAGPMFGLTEEPTTPVDRYSYLPNAFSALLLAWAMSRFWMYHLGSWSTRVALYAGMSFIPIIGLQSHRQLQIWQSSYTLFAYLKTTPEIRSQPYLQYHIDNLMAGQLVAYGDFNSALHIYEALTRYVPNNYQYWRSLGLVAHLLGKDSEALKAFNAEYAIDRSPETRAIIQSIENNRQPNEAEARGNRTESPGNSHAHGP